MRLITRLLQRRYVGWVLEGPIYRPGQLVDRPESLVALECAGPQKPCPGPRRRCEDLWIVWYWQDDDWREIARCAALGRDWECILIPAIRNLLERRHSRQEKRQAAIAAIRDCMADQAEALDPDDFLDVLNAVWLQVESTRVDRGWFVGVA